MFRIRVIAKTELYVARKDIGYAIKSDQLILFYKSPNHPFSNWTDAQHMQYDAHWFVPEERAYVFASVKNMLNALRGICKKDETYSRYEVVFIDNTTQSLDDFLKLHRK